MTTEFPRSGFGFAIVAVCSLFIGVIIGRSLPSRQAANTAPRPHERAATTHPGGAFAAPTVRAASTATPIGQILNQLESATADDLPAIWGSIQGADEFGGNSVMLIRMRSPERFLKSLVIRHWATLDPKGAVAFLAELPNPKERRRHFDTALDHWAKLDPKAATAAARELDEETLGRDPQRYEREFALLGQPITGARIDAMVAGGSSEKEIFRICVKQWCEEDPFAALRWAEGKESKDYIAYVASRWPSHRISELLPAISHLLGEQRVLWSVTAHLRRVAPDATFEWAQNAPEEYRLEALSGIIDPLSTNTELLEFFATLPPEDLSQIDSLGNLLRTSHRPPEELWQWANALGEGVSQHMLKSEGWLFAQNWFDLDQQGAIETLATLDPSERGSWQFARGIGDRMSASEDAAALVAFGDQLSGEARAGFFMGAAGSALLTPNKVFELLESQRPDDPAAREIANQGFSELARFDQERAERWLGTLPSGALHDEMSVEFAEEIARDNPDQAFATLSRVEDSDARRRGLQAVVSGYLERDPLAALEFVERADISPEDARQLRESLAEE